MAMAMCVCLDEWLDGCIIDALEICGCIVDRWVDGYASMCMHMCIYVCMYVCGPAVFARASNEKHQDPG